MDDQCCCYPGGTGLGKLVIERRQQEILAALTKTMPTGSEGLPLVFSVFVRIRSLFEDRHGIKRGNYFLGLHLHGKSPTGLQLKGYGK